MPKPVGYLGDKFMAQTTVEEEFLHYTGKAGDISRQLGLAGVAVIWLFHTATASEIQIPPLMRLPLYLICVSLGLDLVQYVFGSCSWGWLLLCKNKGQDHGDKHKVQLSILLVIIILKLIVMIAAYGFLLKRLLPLIRL
jgi:H+/Cl- antiporter ClcA